MTYTDVIVFKNNVVNRNSYSLKLISEFLADIEFGGYSAYRYYGASKPLTEEDLKYKMSEIRYLISSIIVKGESILLI
jgi:hypothetical protein